MCIVFGSLSSQCSHVHPKRNQSKLQLSASEQPSVNTPGLYVCSQPQWLEMPFQARRAAGLGSCGTGHLGCWGSVAGTNRAGCPAPSALVPREVAGAAAPRCRRSPRPWRGNVCPGLTAPRPQELQGLQADPWAAVWAGGAVLMTLFFWRKGRSLTVHFNCWHFQTPFFPQYFQVVCWFLFCFVFVFFSQLDFQPLIWLFGYEHVLRTCLLTAFSSCCSEIQKAELSELLVPSKTEAFKFKALHLNEPCLKSVFSVSKCALLSHPDETEAESLSYRQMLWSACCVLAGTEQCVPCVPWRAEGLTQPACVLLFT